MGTKLSNSTTAVAETPINNFQQMWDAVVAYLQAGTFDTDAMFKVYQRMDPRLTYQNISDVFSGVYADSYWNDTFMDPNILSMHLQQALGLSPSLADSYATSSTSQWRGLLVRKNISDIGTIPVAGGYTASLDIVCNNNSPLGADQLIQNWNSDFWQTPQIGKNYVYVRCANVQFWGDVGQITPSANYPTAQMFYTTGGFNQPPSSWIQCLTASTQSTIGRVLLLGDVDAGKMPIGTRAVSEGFIFSPVTADHVCVIGVIATGFFSKNTPLSIPPGNWNSTTFITHNGAAGWKNVDPQKSSDTMLDFYNQDETNENFVFEVSCRNVPVGSKISLSSDDAHGRFSSPITSISRSSQTIRKTVTLPGHHHGKLKVHMSAPNGNMLPENAAVTVSMKWRVSPGHDSYQKAAALPGNHAAAQRRAALELPLGSYTLTGGAK